jgi:osmotically-inducible protein OsmY
MNPITRSNIVGWTISMVAALGSVAWLSATPSMEPTGDSEIASFIEMELQSDGALKSVKTAVKVENGIAVISGKARSLAQVERATARAIANTQVFAVVNQMEVNTTTEAEIQKSAALSLKSQKLIRAEGVKVTTAGSRLILDGEVGTWDESDLAREIVSEIAGVTAVENRLTVNFEGVRTDEQIAAHLQFLIKDDPLFTGLSVVARVKDGTVTLNGEVGTAGEVDRLVRRSYVTGVFEVESSGLKVNRDLAMEAVGDKAYTPEQSLSALQAALAHDSRLNASTIRLGLDDGVMQLKGTVATLRLRDSVETTARGIPGVLRVDNQLEVSAGTEVASHPAGVNSASAPVVRGSSR